MSRSSVRRLLIIWPRYLDAGIALYNPAAWVLGTRRKTSIARRSDMSPQIAFGCWHSPTCCPLSNAFETATRAYRHLANGKNKKRDRQTDGRTYCTIALCSVPQGGAIITQAARTCSTNGRHASTQLQSAGRRVSSQTRIFISQLSAASAANRWDSITGIVGRYLHPGAGVWLINASGPLSACRHSKSVTSLNHLLWGRWKCGT